MSNLPKLFAKSELFIYTTKFVPQSISLNSDFSLATWSMTALSAGTDDIVAQSGVAISTPDISFTPVTWIYANQSVTYNKLQLEVEYSMKSLIFYLNKATEIASILK